MREFGLTRWVRDPQEVEIYDPFAGGVASGAIGSLGWVQTASGTGTNVVQASVLHHPGILRLVTGTTSGNNKRIHLTSTASDPAFDPALFDRFVWVVRVPTITTLTIRLGLMQDISAANGGTAGAFWQFDTNASTTNWQAFTRQASTSPSAVGGPTMTANNWYVLEMRRLASGNWEAWANGSLQGTLSANLPTTSCNFGALVQTGAAQARNLDLDLCYARGFAGQLWT